jgi:4-hydroxythreonine-4-phosphate dehydrogenase
MTRPRIGLTCGDPGGIGPEVVLKALSGPELPPAEYLLFGPPSILTAEAKRLGLPDALERCPLQATDSFAPSLQIRGKPDPENGRMSFAAVEQAVAQARTGRLQAVVTAPVSKRSWQLAGIPWAGHTEYLERDYPDAIMSFVSDRLNVALFTHHLPLKTALQHIRREKLLHFLRRLYPHAQRVLGGDVQLLISGLNPHAGEQGMLGNEEQDEIIPALEILREEGIPVSGPHPPDIINRMALDRPSRMVVALYHDQGLIAFKLLAFEQGVNMTLGLPFVRTSPDHGTAFDIAGRNSADPGSMQAAVRLAHRVLTRSAHNARPGTSRD